MSKALTDAIEGRGRRHARLEPEVAPPPPWDLSMVRLPRWLMPALRDLMEVAERTFGPRKGIAKKVFVERSLDTVFAIRDGIDPEDFAPIEYRVELVSILIEGVWNRNFRDRPSDSPLSEALRKLKGLSGKLSRAHED